MSKVQVVILTRPINKNPRTGDLVADVIDDSVRRTLREAYPQMQFDFENPIITISEKIVTIGIKMNSIS